MASLLADEQPPGGFNPYRPVAPGPDIDPVVAKAHATAQMDAFFGFKG